MLNGLAMRLAKESLPHVHRRDRRFRCVMSWRPPFAGMEERWQALCRSGCLRWHLQPGNGLRILFGWRQNTFFLDVQRGLVNIFLIVPALLSCISMTANRPCRDQIQDNAVSERDMNGPIVDASTAPAWCAEIMGKHLCLPRQARPGLMLRIQEVVFHD